MRKEPGSVYDKWTYPWSFVTQIFHNGGNIRPINSVFAYLNCDGSISLSSVLYYTIVLLQISANSI